MLEEALSRGQTEVFNTDQGVQFTAHADNVFVERLWRSVKHEDIFIHRHESAPQLEQGLRRYFPYFNEERFHQSLPYHPPAGVYRVVRGQRQG